MVEDFGSVDAAKKGGEARAATLTKVQRSTIAKQAAAARWHADVPRATHYGDMTIGAVSIPCAVLDDKTRVLTQRGFSVALGRHKNPKKNTVVELPVFLQASNLNSFIDEDLRRSSNPIRFKLPEGNSGGTDGSIAFGYRADLLPKVCDVYIQAKMAGKLRKSQYHMAEQARILLNGLATVGIIAMVDEATGYQREREQGELAKILEAFVAKELQKWLPTFDLEFYELICEIRGEPLARVKARPPYFGKLTNNLVYTRLAPGVLQKLRELNPVDDNGRRKHKHFQHLTPQMGHPKLKEHLAGVITALKMAKLTGMNWENFLAILDKTHPKWHPMPLLDGLDEEKH